MLLELFVIILFFIVPTILLRYNLVKYSHRMIILYIAFVFVVLCTLFFKFGFEDLGIYADYGFNVLMSYFFITIFILAFISLIYYSEFRNTALTFNLVSAAIIISTLQEFSFRGFLIPLLERIYPNVFFVLFFNVFIFWFIHLIYTNTWKSHLVMIAGSVCSTIVYILYPNLVFAIISHIIINIFAINYYRVYGSQFIKKASRQ